MIVFRYKREKSGTLRLVAPVVMKANELQTEVCLYIDSGADISMIPRSAGEALGFDDKKEGIKEMKGIAGEGVPFVERTVTMILGGEEEIEVPVAWALIEGVPPLLGRKGVFSRFRIVFDEAAETIECHKR